MARSSDSAVERVLNQQEVTEAARLARHKRLAAADKATSSPAKSSLPSPSNGPSRRFWLHGYGRRSPMVLVPSWWMASPCTFPASGKEVASPRTHLVRLRPRCETLRRTVI